jgi:ABC-2 type transport system ATP-binding protein
VHEAGARFAQTGPDTYRVSGLPVAHVGHLAFTRGVELHELQAVSFNLEQLFFALTQGAPDQPPPAGPRPSGQVNPGSPR